ncbi:MAG: hypothetical protein RJA47_842 [Actinomycetota bacterium]|jgi:hypothetical protein
MSGEHFDDIIGQLESISETLGDRSIELLREAIASGSGQRPAGEKTIAQARRAIDKAVHLLSGMVATSD